jgi:hypothetical protein
VHVHNCCPGMRSHAIEIHPRPHFNSTCLKSKAYLREDTDQKLLNSPHNRGPEDAGFLAMGP